MNNSSSTSRTLEGVADTGNKNLHSNRSYYRQHAQDQGLRAELTLDQGYIQETDTITHPFQHSKAMLRDPARLCLGKILHSTPVSAQEHRRERGIVHGNRVKGAQDVHCLGLLGEVLARVYKESLFVPSRHPITRVYSKAQKRLTTEVVRHNFNH